MNEQEYDEALLFEIKSRISANIEELKLHKDDIAQSAFFDGANTALEELALQFGLADDFGVLVKQID